MTRAVHVPYTVEQDEDGVWCAHAQLRPGAVQSDNVKDGSLLTRDFNPRDLPKGPKGDSGATNVVIRASTGLATVRSYAIAWRQDNATAELEANGFKLTLAGVLALARKQDARLRTAAR